MLGTGALATLRAYIQLDHGKGTWAKVQQVQLQILQLVGIQRGLRETLADRLQLKERGLLRVFAVTRESTFVQVLPPENWDLPAEAQVELSGLIRRRMAGTAVAA